MNLNNYNTEATEYARRGALKKKGASKYMIEGRSLSITELAEMAQCSNSTMSERLRRARCEPGAVTFEKLGITL